MKGWLLALLLGSVALSAMNLTLLWSYRAGYSIDDLAFADNGNLAVAPSVTNCAYVFSPNGTILNKVCGGWEMYDVSYCCGVYAFVNWDQYVYVTYKNGTVIEKFLIGSDYNRAVSLVWDGFVACNDKCGFFSFKSNMTWSVDVKAVDNGPAYYEGFWYVPNWLNWTLTIISNSTGYVPNSLFLGESVWDAKVCNDYLAVSTRTRLFLFSLKNNVTHPRELWRVRGFNNAYQIAFSPDCKYIAVADKDNKELKIYDINGTLVFSKAFGSNVNAVDWWMDRIAVGLNNGNVYVYKVEGYNATVTPTSTKLALILLTNTSTTSTIANSNGTTQQTTVETVSVKLPSVALISILIALITRRRGPE